MKNKLRAIWNILMGRPVAYRIGFGETIVVNDRYAVFLECRFEHRGAS